MTSAKRRHHYVPRFYLKAFSSDAPQDPRRIHLFNLRRSLAVQGASLRDQCYAHRLYGEDDTLEDAFATIDGLASQVIARIRLSRKAPAFGHPDHFVLMVFIAYQMARTEASIAKTKLGMERMEHAAFDGKGPPAEWGKSEDQAMELSLSSAPLVAESLRDLALVLVEAAPGHAFVTSDSPVFLYNQYCEGIKHSGVTGTKAEGLQLFFPIAPDMLLFAYDAHVYKVGTRALRGVTRAAPSDMAALNRLPFVSARENVYFSKWPFATGCAVTAAGVEKERERSKTRVTVADDENNPLHQLLHLYAPMPQLSLALSFVGVRRNARRVDLYERARRDRRPYATPKESRLPGEGGSYTRFVVKRR
jgi:hypothetical protein